MAKLHSRVCGIAAMINTLGIAGPGSLCAKPSMMPAALPNFDAKRTRRERF